MSIIGNGNPPFQNYIFHAMIISQSVLETNVIKVITFELLHNDLVLPFCAILCIVVLGIVQLRENILFFVVSYT